jgi:hypothetical protein
MPSISALAPCTAAISLAIPGSLLWAAARPSPKRLKFADCVFFGFLEPAVERLQLGGQRRYFFIRFAADLLLFRAAVVDPLLQAAGLVLQRGDLFADALPGRLFFADLGFEPLRFLCQSGDLGGIFVFSRFACRRVRRCSCQLLPFFLNGGQPAFRLFRLFLSGL